MIRGGSRTLKLFLFVLAWLEMRYSTLFPRFSPSDFSHQTENYSLFMQKEKKWQLRMRQLNIVLGNWTLSPASVAKFLCDTRQVRRQNWLVCGVIFGSLAIGASCSAEVLSTYGCNSAQWELCFQNGMWCYIIMHTLQNEILHISYWCIIS